MAQAGKGRLNYRCPSCFMRDIDIDMFYDIDFLSDTLYYYDKEKDEYYCLRCQYRGDEKNVLEKNELARFRYGMIGRRITIEDYGD